MWLWAEGKWQENMLLLAYNFFFRVNPSIFSLSIIPFFSLVFGSVAVGLFSTSRSCDFGGIRDISKYIKLVFN